MTRHRFLVLGGGEGWHAQQLRAAAAKLGCRIDFAPYELLSAKIGIEEVASHATNQLGHIQKSRQERQLGVGINLAAEVPLADYDAVLTRTMPAGTLEQITFRLAVLHDHQHDVAAIVNPPRTLEIAIDKFATLAEIRRLGVEVPRTVVTQSRTAAMQAFLDLGSDCIIKPIFGGEGRGVMRVRDEELAWTVASTLERLNAVFYVQTFVPPGGRDIRMLVVGDNIHGVRRTNGDSFRTNVRGGAVSERVELTREQQHLAMRIARRIGLRFGSIDLLDGDDDVQRVVEVNAVPGWRASQDVLEDNIAEQVVDLLRRESCAAKAESHE